MYYFVRPYEKDRALNRLNKLVETGYKESEITKINDVYYLRKICSGMIPMSNIIYERIMGMKPEREESPEGGYIPTAGLKTYRCRECGRDVGYGDLLCGYCCDKDRPNFNVFIKTVR